MENQRKKKIMPLIDVFSQLRPPNPQRVGSAGNARIAAARGSAGNARIAAAAARGSAGNARIAARAAEDARTHNWRLDAKKNAYRRSRREKKRFFFAPIRRKIREFFAQWRGKSAPAATPKIRRFSRFSPKPQVDADFHWIPFPRKISCALFIFKVSDSHITLIRRSRGLGHIYYIS